MHRSHMLCLHISLHCRHQIVFLSLRQHCRPRLCTCAVVFKIIMTWGLRSRKPNEGLNPLQTATFAIGLMNHCSPILYYREHRHDDDVADVLHAAQRVYGSSITPVAMKTPRRRKGNKIAPTPINAKGSDIGFLPSFSNLEPHASSGSFSRVRRGGACKSEGI